MLGKHINFHAILLRTNLVSFLVVRACYSKLLYQNFDKLLKNLRFKILVSFIFLNFHCPRGAIMINFSREIILGFIGFVQDIIGEMMIWCFAFYKFVGDCHRTSQLLVLN